MNTRTDRSVLSSRGGLAREPKGEHSIELAQLASRVDSAMHAEISSDDDPFAKVLGLISVMSTRLEEKASADATHKATSNVYTVVHRTDGLKTIVKCVHGVSQLFSFFNETYYPEDMHAIITVLKEAGVKSTATPAQLTVDGKVSEAFAPNEAPHAAAQVVRDLDDFTRFRYHEIEFHGVSRITQLA